MTLNPSCATLAAAVVTIAATFALPPVWAATSPYGGVQADLGNSSLTVRLNADGSVAVSQAGKAGAAAITLPSIQALPAEIDALVPPPRQKKKLAVRIEPAMPWKTFMILMNQARGAGFGDVGFPGFEKTPCGGSSELTIHLLGDNKMPSGKPLFVSLGNDGNVILTLGLGADAHGKTVSPAEAPDAAAGLVPKGRAKTQAFYRADLDVPFSKGVNLMRRLGAIGFCKIGLVGEATE